MAVKNIEIEADLASFWPEIFWVNFIITLNAILGLALFEWAWSKTVRYRNPIKELDAQFPELARLDAKKWVKWKHYPGAVTLMIPRILFVILMLLLVLIGINILMIGHDRSLPMTGSRKWMCRAVIKFVTTMISVVCF